MKHISLVSLVLSLFLTVPGCSEKRDHADGHVSGLPADSVHDGWFFAAGETVTIDGTVNGDVYAAGGVIEVNGVINGDLLVAGGSVTVAGVVSDDIRAGGGNIEIKGSVGKNVTAAGGNVTLDSQAFIDGNLLVAGGNIVLNGLVGEELKAASGSLTINGGIIGNAEFAGGNLTFGPSGRVGGDLDILVEDPEHVQINEGHVAGDITVTVHVKEESDRSLLGFHPLHFWMKMVWFGSLLLTGLVLVLVFPKQMNELGTSIGDHPGEVTLWGLAGLIAVPVAATLLFVTVIGIPLGLLLLISYFWLLYVSQLALGVFIGQRLLVSREKTGWSLVGVAALGTLILQMLTFVPIVRFVVIGAGLVFGLGALLSVLQKELALRR